MYTYKITFAGSVEKIVSSQHSLSDKIKYMTIGQKFLCSEELIINVDNVLFIDLLPSEEK